MEESWKDSRPSPESRNNLASRFVSLLHEEDQTNRLNEMEALWKHHQQ